MWLVLEAETDTDGRVAAAAGREVDMVVAQVASAMPVDVMAGAADPANQALPQQALHACLLPTAAAYPTLHRHTPRVW